jgi:hypothetical protein
MIDTGEAPLRQADRARVPRTTQQARTIDTREAPLRQADRARMPRESHE